VTDLAPRHCLVCDKLIAKGRRCPCEVARRAKDYGPAWRKRSKDLTSAAGARCESCGTCGDPANPLTTDHVVPLARGGTRDVVAVLCRRCNASKRDRLRPGRRA